MRAVYRSGFEWSDLYSLKCFTGKSVWVSGNFKYCGNGQDVNEFAAAGGNPWNGSTAGIVAIGKLYGGGNHGHLNAYDLKFELKCVEKADRLLEVSYVPTALSDEQRRKIEEWESLK